MRRPTRVFGLDLSPSLLEERIRRRTEEMFARGETIWHAIIAPVPRALWPNKPIVAGSGDLVSRYTGIMFAEGTSVGIGPVMEMYVNFGSAGVFVGFIVIGLFLGYIDFRAGESLRRARTGPARLRGHPP